MIKKGMSIEAVAKVVDIALNRLPDMEMILEQTTKAVARKQVDLEYLEKRICYLEEEEKRRRENSYFTYFFLLLCREFWTKRTSLLLFYSRTATFITISAIRIS